MSFFVNMVEGEYVLTTPGYAVSIVLGVLVLLLAVYLAKKAGGKKTMGTKQLVFCAASIALATITSFIEIYSFPFGGSITLCSMLFVCYIGYLYGPGTGILTGVAYGILQFIMKPYIYFPIQILVDYPLAFGALGLSGFFWKAKNGLIKGYLFGIIGRYVFAVISGWIFFGEYAWEGWNPLPYSLVYNGCYIFAEGAITIILLLLPPVAKAFQHIKKMSVN